MGPVIRCAFAVFFERFGVFSLISVQFHTIPQDAFVARLHASGEPQPETEKMLQYRVQ